MDDLTTAVFPAGVADERWASDVFIEWPGPTPSLPVSQLRAIRCTNGRVIVVPVLSA
jgi:hypothetical protein